MQFSRLGLPDSLARALEKQGIETPTPIQAQAIPHALEGRDLLASARTGTGKTLAFALPIVSRLIADNDGAALILVPTRELATQVLDVLKPLLAGTKLGAPCLLIGGLSMYPQVQALRRNPRIVVATPGRLLDHLKQGGWKGAKLRCLVLDEADRMLDMGFGPQVKSVLRFFPGDRQTFLFSATYSKELKSIAKEFLRDPVEVFVDPPSSLTTTVDEKVIESSVAGKQEALIDALNEREGRVIIFVRTKRRVDRLAHYLKQYGHDVDAIHGDRSQGQRQRALDAFRRETIRILVATDIAARGLDIPLVPYVMNFDLPEQREDYVHRIGRTGRAGSAGEAVTFVTPEDKAMWAEIQGKAKAGSAPRAPRGPKRPPSERAGGGRPGGGGRDGGGRNRRFGGGRPEGGRAGGRSGGRPGGAVYNGEQRGRADGEQRGRADGERPAGGGFRSGREERPVREDRFGGEKREAGFGRRPRGPRGNNNGEDMAPRDEWSSSRPRRGGGDRGDRGERREGGRPQAQGPGRSGGRPGGGGFKPRFSSRGRQAPYTGYES